MTRIADLELSKRSATGPYDEVVLPQPLLAGPSPDSDLLEQPLLPNSPSAEPSTELLAHFVLTARKTSPSAARKAARAVAEAWGFKAGEDVEAVVSELATNAVLAVLRAKIGGVIVVGLLGLTGGGLQVDVWDPAPPPAKAVKAKDRHGDDQAENGRGLLIVAALADEWEQVDVVFGTQVRARLGVAA
jgi:anti-sigma regulatory factor (Ser/Thr protein kinase)